MPGPANAAGYEVSQTSGILTILKKDQFSIRILATLEPGTLAGAVNQMQCYRVNCYDLTCRYEKTSRILLTFAESTNSVEA